LDAVLKQLGGSAQAVSKNHCRAVAVQKTGEGDAGLLAAWRRQGEPQAVEGAPLLAASGMFSWRKVDAGSRLLIDALPKSLAGRGADIAAGWGYLSWAILETRPKVTHITLYEAEKRALELAEKNLTGSAEEQRRDCAAPTVRREAARRLSATLSFLWADATRKLEEAGQGFDWAVMNPPAHDLLHSAPEASAAIFARAAEALKPGAKLYLVANRHLPYERTLEELFSSVVTLSETAEYKVIEATR
jgi:16S rRNA (guanine1207-N2)-methyltransferase